MRCTWLAAVILLSARFVSASPDRYAHLQVAFKRTITEDTVVQGIIKATCNMTETTHLGLVENITFGSDSYPMSDDANEAQMSSQNDNLGPKGKPLTGSGTYEFTLHSHKTGCKQDGTTDLSARAEADMTSLGYFFEYGRDKGLGNLSLAPSWKPATGKGTMAGDGHSVDATRSAIAMANLMVGSMGTLGVYTAATLKSMGPGAQAMQPAMEIIAQDAPLTVSVTKTGFDIGYHVTRTIPVERLNPSTSSEKHTGSRTVTTDVTLTIGAKPDAFEAILEPMGSVPGAKIAAYDKFVPIDLDVPSKDDPKLDAVAFRVYVFRQSDPSKKVTDVPFQVTYSLETSREKGHSINAPLGAAADDDLEWHPIMSAMKLQSKTDKQVVSLPEAGSTTIAIVRSRDFGAYGALRAHVVMKSGEPLEAHLKGKTAERVTIPRDDNDNKIADAWEEQHKADLESTDATWDREHVDGNGNDGDGLSLYEEYRGAMVNGQHVRLDPKKKDLFVLNSAGVDLSGGARIFQKATKDSVVVRICKAGEIDPDKKVVNANSGFGKNSDQHAIVAVNEPIETPTAVAETVPDAPPKDAAGNDIDQRIAIRDNTARSPGHVVKLKLDLKKNVNNRDYNIAHELGHSVGMHHHGDSRPDTVGTFKAWIEAGTAYLVDEAGKPMKFPATYDEHLARTGSQASGDLSCIMAYNNSYDFSLPGHDAKDYPQLHAPASAADHAVLVHIKPRPDGTTLCTSPAGTDINATIPGRPSVFGNAKAGGGNCWSQLCINDAGCGK